MLKQHPRFQEDFKARMPNGVEENEWIFQQAAVWPDIAKGLQGDLKKEYSRPEWHYIDLPYFPTDEDRNELEKNLSLNISFDVPANEDETMNVAQATLFAQRVLADTHASQPDKAKYLSWIFHLVGDAHQPLHASTLCIIDLFPQGDHGGNWIPTEQSKELHALWDGFPGSPGMKFGAVKNKAIALSRNPGLRQAGETATTDLNVATWVMESHSLGEREAYATEVLTHLEGETDHKKIPPLKLSEEYLSNGGQVAEKRLVEAGYRLGGILKKIAGE
jgi:hypothetical protein